MVCDNGFGRKSGVVGLVGACEVFERCALQKCVAILSVRSLSKSSWKKGKDRDHFHLALSARYPIRVRAGLRLGISSG